MSPSNLLLLIERISNNSGGLIRFQKQSNLTNGKDTAFTCQEEVSIPELLLPDGSNYSDMMTIPCKSRMKEERSWTSQVDKILKTEASSCGTHTKD
jgi:hypothetical protein